MKNYLLILLLSIPMIAVAQISGTIKDQNGNPLQFALVCDANNVSNFDKTDENGAYELSQGDSNTKLRIGALRYETIKSTSQRNIVMNPDPLLENDEFHVSFDHLRPGDKYSSDEIKDDFNAGYGKGFYEGNQNEEDNVVIDYENSIDPGGVSIKVKYATGQVGTGDSGIDTRLPIRGTFKDNPLESHDLYLSYWVKFSDNFAFDKCGGKLPSLGGYVHGTRSDARWKGRIMWRKGGSIQFYMELPGDGFRAEDNERFWGEKILEGEDSDIPEEFPEVCRYEYTNFLKSPGWHNIELHYKFETPGQNDGYFEGWVDGSYTKRMNSSVFNYYRPVGSEREGIAIKEILLSTFFGGSKPDQYAPTEPVYAWFDEFRVSKTRINEWDKYMGTLAVNENQTQNLNLAYPNPSTGVYTLSENTNWEIYDLLGKTVKRGLGSRIDISGHSKGMYFLRTDTSDRITKLMLR